MADDILIIGIDGGASKVSAHQIILKNDVFALGNHKAIREYQNYSEFQTDFIPVDLKTQLSEIQSHSIKLTEKELAQSKAYYRAFIDAINAIVTMSEFDKVLIGIGLPGIKSADGRGIIAMANGPRMPNFASELESRLVKNGINLVQPIAKLGSDADYCGIGEEYAEEGAFRMVSNAYYLGGGTGAADALKLGGKLISFDDCRDWLAKTWEFKSKDGKTMEAYCSANGIQSIYSEISSVPQNELIKQKVYLEQILYRAYSGEIEAMNTWEIVTETLALLLYERISTIYSGYQNIFEFIDPNHSDLQKDHEYLGTLLDKIIIGQRLGDIFKNKVAHEIIINPLLSKLTELVMSDSLLDEKAKSHYIKRSQFNSNILTTSRLRSAPVLGAGIDAWNSYVSI